MIKINMKIVSINDSRISRFLDYDNNILQPIIRDQLKALLNKRNNCPEEEVADIDKEIIELLKEVCIEYGPNGQEIRYVTETRKFKVQSHNKDYWIEKDTLEESRKARYN